MKKNNLFILFTFFHGLLAANNQSTALYNQAINIHKQHPESAIDLLQQSLDIHPCIDAHYMRAYLLKQLGRMAQTIPHYEYVLKHEPNHSSAHIGIAQAYLALGNYAQGWAELEWRLGKFYEDVSILRTMLQYNRSLQGKIILIRAEWGAGDAIQMIRYAQLLKEKGAIVNIHLLHQSLIPLFKMQFYFDTVISPTENPPPFHLQIPLMSLPLAFDTTLNSIPSTTPYIHINKTLMHQWKEKLKSDVNFKIGICWRGNYIHDQKKFMPLSYFAQLAQCHGISVYSLQKMHGLDELHALNDTGLIKTFGDDFDATPFMDTAAIMKNLDLVITVDTSIAHLAGALGVAVWVVLPHTADWRWLQNRQDTPWYPAMRLFRQPEPGEWQTLIDTILASLKLLTH